MIARRPLGATGIEVSEIALGAGPLGDPAVLDDRAAEMLIGEALELGVNLVDTAPSYGRSEERIGSALRGKRDRVVLSTKLGYGVPGIADWTGPVIAAGIDRALARLQTSWIDIAHLHSCPVDVLARGEVVEALAAARAAGKIRVAAYSGDNAALAWAIADGRFGCVQCSVNIADQRALDAAIPDARARGLGVLAKRPLANGTWRGAAIDRPDAPDRATYRDRLHAMAVEVTAERALGFVLAQPVSAVLVGTTSIAHLHALTACRALPAAPVAQIRAAFQRHDDHWDGVI